MSTEGPTPEDCAAGPAPGDTIHGRYRLESLEGRDSTGSHFRAVDELTEDPVFLTVVHAALLPEPEAVRRFLKAGARMRGLRHPGHRSVYDVNVSPDKAISLKGGHIADPAKVALLVHIDLFVVLFFDHQSVPNHQRGGVG